MATKKQNNITFMPVVESISRKFALRKEKCTKTSLRDGKVVIDGISFMGAGVRQSYAAGYGSFKKNYFFMRKNPRSTPVKSAEVARRKVFGDASECVAHITTDLMQITQIYDLWEQAVANLTLKMKGISAKGYNYRGWIFAVCYKRLQDGESISAVKTFPTAFDA